MTPDDINARLDEIFDKKLEFYDGAYARLIEDLRDETISIATTLTQQLAEAQAENAKLLKDRETETAAHDAIDDHWEGIVSRLHAELQRCEAALTEIASGLSVTNPYDLANDTLRQAESNVLAARGNYDAPGFDACVAAELRSLTQGDKP